MRVCKDGPLLNRTGERKKRVLNPKVGEERGRGEDTRGICAGRGGALQSRPLPNQGAGVDLSGHRQEVLASEAGPESRTRAEATRRGNKFIQEGDRHG